MNAFKFPKGWHPFHRTQIFNYQLNRWHSMGYLSEARCREAGQLIKRWKDWPQVCEQQAQATQGLESTFWYRAAEFFVPFSHPDKTRLYDHFREGFYDWLEDHFPAVEYTAVPYASGALPTLKIEPSGEPISTVLLFGGFDSFKEELFSLGWFLAEAGHRVLLFEGPGQGEALHKHGLPMHYGWEKPLSALLDHFDEEEVTLIGISMGGWLCFRAAAFEPRIRRVLASSIAYDYLLMPPKWAQSLAKTLLKVPALIRFSAHMKAAILPQERWGMENMKGIFQAEDLHVAMQSMLQLNATNQQAHRVRQDVRIHTGAEDHFIPLKMHRMQVEALTQVASLSERIYTANNQAQNHCQVGNWELAAQDMVNWIQERLEKEGRTELSY